MVDHAGRETEADQLNDAPPPTEADQLNDAPPPTEADQLNDAPPPTEPGVLDPVSASARSASPAALMALAWKLQALAIDRGVTVGSAESCTGGLVGHAITEIAGSSAYYVGGVVSYADDVKVQLLGVPAPTLSQHGAVSAQVAVAMADGVRRLVDSTYALAVTGVAGPDGGSPAKPVGLTYVAAAGPNGHEVRRHTWSGDRASNKIESARASLELLVDLIEADPADAGISG